MSKFPDSLTNLVQFDGQTTYMAPEFGKWGSYLVRPAVSRTTGISNHHRTRDEVLEQGEQLASDDKAASAFPYVAQSMVR